MAKSKIQYKKVTNENFSIEGELNIVDGKILINVEEEGEKDLTKALEKYNEKYIKITIGEKTEEDLSDELDGQNKEA